MFSKALDDSAVSFEPNLLQYSPVFRELGRFAKLLSARCRHCSDNKVLVCSISCLSEFRTLKTHRLTAWQQLHLLGFFSFSFLRPSENAVKNGY